MKFTVKWFGNQFNLNIHKAEGEPEFLSIKGLRIANGSNGEFVSYPSTKKEDGKYWNHCWGEEKFNSYVLGLAKESQPQQQAPAPQRSAPAAPPDDYGVPF